MHNKYILPSLLIVAAAGLSSCDDYLDEAPRKSQGIEISTAEQLEALLNTESVVGNSYVTWFASDCNDLTAEYYDVFKELGMGMTECQMNTWNMKMLESANPADTKWGDEYGRIFNANLVLQNIDGVSGSDALKEEVRARAYTARAYSYLELANYYCMPYGSSTLSTLGLSLKTRPDYEENIARATLKETYDFIESDVLNAVKLTRPLINSSGKREAYIQTAALANAVASRFYLNKGDYANAQKYAEAALEQGGGMSDLMNLSTDVTMEVDPFTGESQPSTAANNTGQKDYYGDTDHAYSVKYSSDLFAGCCPVVSEKFLNLFDKEYDLRYKYFYNPNYENTFYFGLGSLYFMFMNLPHYNPYSDFYLWGINSAEMVLTIAECKARLNDVSGAMQTLNQFRAYRYAADTPSDVLNLTASSQKEAIKLVLDERTKEFPYSVRWNDIRRLNFNDDPDDDVTITRQFYGVNANSVDGTVKTYTLSPQTLDGYAVAIPQSEVTSSGGVIKQNEYTAE